MNRLFTIVLFLLASLPALAEEAKFKPLILTVDMGRRPMESCIGIPITPLCGFKTWLSCFSGVASSCSAIAVARSKPNENSYPIFGKYLFKILEVSKINPKVASMLPAGRNPAGLKWVGLDHIEITYTTRQCRKEEGKKICIWWENSKRIVFKQVKGHWLLTRWNDGDLTCEYAASPSIGPFNRYCDWLAPMEVNEKINQAYFWAEARGIEYDIQIDPKSLLKPEYLTTRIKTN